MWYQLRWDYGQAHAWIKMSKDPEKLMAFANEALRTNEGLWQWYQVDGKDAWLHGNGTNPSYSITPLPEGFILE